VTREKKLTTLIILSWWIALIATLGSLYLSDILQYVPCVLCWYQRIALYPLIVLLPVSIFRKDYHIYSYVLPLVSIGGVFAFYHLLLQYGIITENILPCQLGVSCSTRYIEWFGFITIPLLSFLTFVSIGFCMWYIKKVGNYGK